MRWDLERILGPAVDVLLWLLLLRTINRRQKECSNGLWRARRNVGLLLLGKGSKRRAQSEIE